MKNTLPCCQFHLAQIRQIGAKLRAKLIISKSKDIKENIISNLIGNIRDQNQRNTIVEFASALGLAHKCHKATHIECLKQLYVIYGTEYIHVLSDSKLHYENYVFTMKYPAKRKCLKVNCWHNSVPVGR